jgi:ubiquinone/menaquinone biosynthesis C-methylase UbiE
MTNLTLLFCISGIFAILVLADSGAAPPEPERDPNKPAAPPQTQPHGHHHAGDATDDATARHPFTDVERWVATFDDPARAEWQKPEEVVKTLGLRPGMNVADIGAGTGYFNRFLAAAVAPGGKVYAADIEPKMVEHMKERAEKEKTPNVVPVLAEPDDPKLPEGAIDVVLICNTYHHFDNRLAYFDRIRKKLRPGGRIAIVDFQKRDLPVGPAMEHKLPRDHVVAEMEKAGYKLASEPTFLPYQYFLIFAPR